MPIVKVGDINTYYEIHGKGEALALIMGYGASMALWFRQIPAFSQEYRVVAFDNRGSGQSGKPDVPYTMAMMADDLAMLLDAIGIETAHVFGVSMGGMIAQHFSLRYPQRVRNLVLGSTSCGGSHSIIDKKAMKTLFDMEHLKLLTPEERAKEIIPFLVSQEFIDQNPNLVQQRIAKMMEHPAPFHGYMRQAQAIEGHDTYERLPDIRVPTLIIAGDADILVPVENSRILASRIPNAELLIMKNVGHALIESENEVNSVVLDFLRHNRCTG